MLVTAPSLHRRRARTHRPQPHYYAEIAQSDGRQLGFVGCTFNLVKSPKARLVLHTRDLDDWERLIALPKGARLLIRQTEPTSARR